MALDGGAVKKMTLVSNDGVSFEVDEAAVAAEFEKMTLESGAVVKKMTLVSRDGVSFEVDEAAVASEFEKMALESGAVKVKKMKLVSCDGVSFDVDEAVATEFRFKRLIKHYCTDNRILLPTVKSHILAKVMEYCKKHAEARDEEELKAWDVEFVTVDEFMSLDDHIKLHDPMKAANYMRIYSLVVLIATTVVRRYKGMTREQIFESLNIEMTPEKRERVMMDEKVVKAGLIRTVRKHIRDVKRRRCE